MDYLNQKKKILSMIKLVLCGIGDFFGIVFFIPGLTSDLTDGKNIGMIVVGLILLGFCTFKLLRIIFKSKCTECGKRWTYILIDTKVIDVKDISVKVKENKYAKDGSADGYSERYIPGTRTTYREKWQCTNCGNEIEYTYSTDAANL